MKKRLGPLLILVAALIIFMSSRLAWVTAFSEDDKAGSAANDILGSNWSLELMGVGFLLLAGGLAGFALRKTARRIVGIICALGGAAAAWAPISLLTYGADLERAQNVLRSARENTRAVDVTTISDWAIVTEAETNVAGPILAIFGAALALFGGILLATNPGEDSVKSNKYETLSARVDKLEEDLESSPDSGRVMWDALDADIDPTDFEGGHGGAAGGSGRPS